MVKIDLKIEELIKKKYNKKQIKEIIETKFFLKSYIPNEFLKIKIKR